MVDQERLRNAVIEWALKLIPTDGIDPLRLLCAVLHNESSYGVNDTPRFEKAYAPGGYYYRKSDFVRRQYSRWGAWACCSYGPFQILYITACEMGFTGTPGQLWDVKASIPFVIDYINRRILRKPGNETVRQIGDAYNSGSFQDQIIPEKYMDDFETAYNSNEFINHE